MKRKIVLTLAVILAATLVLQPYQGHSATQLDKINKEIKALEHEMKRKADQKKSAEKQVQALTGQKQATKEEIEALLKEIDAAGKKVAETEGKISDMKDRLVRTGQELDVAKDQEAATGDKLDSRIRLMYTNGTVAYMDVLMSSTSFSDFLSRFDAFESITVQTRDLLEDKKELRAGIEEKEAQQTRDLAELQQLYEQEAEEKAELERKENSKEVMVAQLDQQIEVSEDISEESEKLLMDLAKKMAKLQAEKSRIKSYYKGGKLAVPLKSYSLSSPFGYRIHPISKKRKLHTGLDMSAPSGTPMYAAESGVVIVAQWWSGYGNCIIIDHGGGLWTLYGHIKNGGILVKKGANVKRGQKIALVGSTGQSTGPHLHFEVRKHSSPVNPAPYLK